MARRACRSSVEITVGNNKNHTGSFSPGLDLASVENQNNQTTSIISAEIIFMLFSFLRLQSSLLALQLNSITLMLPYNHFSSLRLDSFPGLTEKRPNYSLTLTLVLIFSLSHSSFVTTLSLSSAPQQENTCSKV